MRAGTGTEGSARRLVFCRHEITLVPAVNDLTFQDQDLTRLRDVRRTLPMNSVGAPIFSELLLSHDCTCPQAVLLCAFDGRGLRVRL